MGDCIRKEPCPKCGSQDNLARYADGGAHCFTPQCGYRENGDGTISDQADTSTKDWSPIEGDCKRLKARGISQETCDKWRYQVGEYKGRPCQIANHFDGGKLIAQKLRFPDKTFKTLGNGKNARFYGQWLWEGGGKNLTITEGEIDALTMSQVHDNKWPVVSLPNGADSAVKTIKNNYEWLQQFDRIVLMFDMDDVGQEAARAAAALLPPGKVCIATLPEKDPNEVLLKHGPKPLVSAFWDAKSWRPDGIRSVSELREEFFNPRPVRGIAWPWKEWNEVIGPWRDSSITTLTGGSGIGKSTVLRELLYAAHEQGESCGALFFEEDGLELMENLVSVRLNKNISIDRSVATPQEIEEGFAYWESSGRLHPYDHFGSSEVDNICAKIEYLVTVCGCRRIFLDHLSIMVSGNEGDERRIIDIAMTKLRTLVNRLKCSLNCVVHLRRPQGDKGHEDGVQGTLNQLRGSHSIAQLSDVVVMINKDADDPNGPNNWPVCIKNRRNGGKKGPMGVLVYDRTTNRLSDEPACEFDEVETETKSNEEECPF